MAKINMKYGSLKIYGQTLVLEYRFSRHRILYSRTKIRTFLEDYVLETMRLKQALWVSTRLDSHVGSERF